MEIYLLFVFACAQAIPAHRHHAQGQLRPRGLHLQVWQNHLAGQRRLRRTQRPADRALHLRNQRAERHRTEGQQTPTLPAAPTTRRDAAVCFCSLSTLLFGPFRIPRSRTFSAPPPLP